MGLTGAGREVEIKLPLPDAVTGRRLLEQLGFVVRKPRFFESNVLYDTPEQRLRSESKMLRIRQADNQTILTYKGPDEPGRHKIREEIELNLSDGTRFAEVLSRLGMSPLFRYEKFRTEYSPADGAGLALLDETPIGVFLELEGPAEWIDRTAQLLGFAEADYVLSSYGQLFLEAVREAPEAPAEMVFRDRGETG